MTAIAAPAKINLALVVGPPRADGKHEVGTVMQQIALEDRIAVAPGDRLTVSGYEGDTLVTAALEALAAAAAVEPGWHARIEKRIPVAAGLGGGSSDAAAALLLANRLLLEPLDPAVLAELAAGIGADVPFFLEPGPRLGRGDGSRLTPLDLPRDYWVVLVLPAGALKASTGSVYARFDDRDGPIGFDGRLASLLDAVASVNRATDLARLPPNDLAASPLSQRLLDLGAFRADVTGAGPCIYGLFAGRAAAEDAATALRPYGRTWVTTPC